MLGELAPFLWRRNTAPPHSPRRTTLTLSIRPSVHASPSLTAIPYPTLGSVNMYLGFWASSPSMRRSRFTTFRNSQPSSTRSGPRPSTTALGSIVRPRVL